jgi:hypothetical protein
MPIITPQFLSKRFPPSSGRQKMKGPEEVVVEAGRRAICYYLDTSDCLFCNVDNAEKGQEHEAHCTFYGIYSAALREWWNATYSNDGKPTK